MKFLCTQWRHFCGWHSDWSYSYSWDKWQ